MSENLIQYGMIAGELSPKLFGRPDLEKYDFGVALACNWVVDYEGGLFTRPGRYFADFLENPLSATKFVKFQFSPTTANTYNIVFGDGYIRFIQDGAYIVESDVTISGATAADPVVVTATGHPYADGDWIKISSIAGMTELNTRTFEVANKTANTFELVNVITDTGLDGSAYTAYTSGGVANRIYTIANPYTATDLAKLKTYQIRDTLRMVHSDYVVKNLTRSSATSWAISNEITKNNTTVVTGITANYGGSNGNNDIVYGITSVDFDGNESLPVFWEAKQRSGPSTSDSVFLDWDIIPDISHYNIYRSGIRKKNQGIYSYPLGFLTKVIGPAYIDAGEITSPDFTLTPPKHSNPFADGRITFIEITAGGSGYTTATVVTVTGTGSGFVGLPIANQTGVLIGVKIVNGGEGWTGTPTISFSVGTGATATATLSETSGNNPTASTIFQQRQLYAATDNNPLSIYGSRPGQFSNFDESDTLIDSDSYDFTLDAETISPIRHMKAAQGGLIIMTQAGIWKLSGGGDALVTPLNAKADLQTNTGVSDIAPLNIDTDVLYITEKDSTVRLLVYSDFEKTHSGKNLALYSNHFFKPTNIIVSWTYAESPHKLVWSVREDGSLLAMAIDKDQNVFAWTQNTTQGLHKDILAVEENGVDVVYHAIERILDGNTVKTIEFDATRTIDHVENSVCVDMGLTLGSTSPAATLTLSAATGTAITLTASASVFVSGDVGSVVRAGGGKITITGYTSGTVLTGDVKRDVTEVISETVVPYVVASGDWTLDTPVTTISGLWHLEGMEVQILADGNRMTDATVANGSLTLANSATRVTVGLKYTSTIQTLPVTAAPQSMIEGHRKSIKGVILREYESRGLQVGATEDNLYYINDRMNENWGEPTELGNHVHYEILSSDWNEDGQFWIVQNDPLPATVLNFVVDLEVGDDND